MRPLTLACCVAALLSGCVATGSRDCEHCPEMVVIPAGTAILGASADDPFRSPDEVPERRIVLREAFAVSRYEVTRDQYEAFVRATNRPVGGDCLTDRVKLGDWQYDAGTTFRDPGFSQAGNHPVACVNWDEARAYIAWLNSQTGGGYRLLTEVEWEYVARGGAAQNLVYPWGNEQAKGCPFANASDQTMQARYASIDKSGYKVYDPMECADGWLNTAPVGSLAPNGFGVYDIIGNVAEWIEDCYSASREPVEGTCAKRLIKGGSWGTLAHNVRIAERIAYPATHRDDSIGIRVAQSIDRTGGSTSSHATTPSKATTADTISAREQCPVRSTSYGATRAFPSLDSTSASDSERTGNSASRPECSCR